MAHPNTGRVLTLRVTITDAEKAKWIWAMGTSPGLGFQIRAIGDGDLFAERDKLKEQLEWFLNNASPRAALSDLKCDLMIGKVTETPAIRDLLAKLADG